MAEDLTVMYTHTRTHTHDSKRTSLQHIINHYNLYAKVHSTTVFN